MRRMENRTSSHGCKCSAWFDVRWIRKWRKRKLWRYQCNADCFFLRENRSSEEGLRRRRIQTGGPEVPTGSLYSRYNCGKAEHISQEAEERGGIMEEEATEIKEAEVWRIWKRWSRSWHWIQVFRREFQQQTAGNSRDEETLVFQACCLWFSNSRYRKSSERYFISK